MEEEETGGRSLEEEEDWSDMVNVGIEGSREGERELLKLERCYGGRFGEGGGEVGRRRWWWW